MVIGIVGIVLLSRLHEARATPGPASSSWVQQASRRKTALGRPRAGRRGPLTQNVPLGSRVVSQKVNFLGQGNKGGLISSAVRRRTDEYPPARLLLPGGLEPRSAIPFAVDMIVTFQSTTVS